MPSGPVLPCCSSPFLHARGGANPSSGHTEPGHRPRSCAPRPPHRRRRGRRRDRHRHDRPGRRRWRACSHRPPRRPPCHPHPGRLLRRQSRAGRGLPAAVQQQLARPRRPPGASTQSRPRLAWPPAPHLGAQHRYHPFTACLDRQRLLGTRSQHRHPSRQRRRHPQVRLHRHLRRPRLLRRARLR